MIQRLQAKRNEEGFTLIELLIVIIVLGILAAIVVFAVGSTRKDSVQASCRTAYKSAELSAEAILTKTGSAPTTLTDLNTASIGGLLKQPAPSDPTADYAFTLATGANNTYTLGVVGAKVVGATTAGADNSVAGCVGK